MSKVSRRGLLHITAGTAGALGISTLATELSAMSTLAPREPESSAANPQAAAPAALGNELFYRDDWLGAPWIKPETALLIHGKAARRLQTGNLRHHSTLHRIEYVNS